MHNHRLTADDFARCAHLVPSWGDARDPVRGRLKTWIDEGRLRGSTYEGGAGEPPLGVGLSGFAKGHAVREYLADPALPMLEHVQRRSEAGEDVLLDPVGVDRARAERDLHVLILLHRAVPADPSDPRAQLMFRIGADAYWLLHGGFGIVGVWHEFPLRDESIAVAGGLEVLARVGDRLVAGLARRNGPAVWPTSLAASLFVDLPEILALTAAQRRVAELALWRLGDSEIAAQLGVSEQTVRRHWRDIYERMEAVLPAAVTPVADESHRGPEKRRHAVDYLVKHIHEVRPALRR